MRQVLCVQVQQPSGAPSTFGFEEGVVRIGRDPGADVRLPYHEVSKLHALIEYFDGDWVLEDVHSTNGTFVNGELTEGVVLKAGDVISIDQCRILVGIEYRIDHQPLATALAHVTDHDSVHEALDEANERTIKAWK